MYETMKLSLYLHCAQRLLLKCHEPKLCHIRHTTLSSDEMTFYKLRIDSSQTIFPQLYTYQILYILRMLRIQNRLKNQKTTLSTQHIAYQKQVPTQVRTQSIDLESDFYVSRYLNYVKIQEGKFNLSGTKNFLKYILMGRASKRQIGFVRKSLCSSERLEIES